MTDNVSGGLPRRGQTYLGANTGRTITDTDAASVEGATKLFDDFAPGQASGAKVRRSNRQTTCILVRNTSGIALLPKRIARWESGYRGKRVDGYTTATAAEAAGVIDEHLPASGVSDNDLFWLAVKGPSLVLTSLAGDAENVISIDDALVALTAATSQATTAGRVNQQDLTGATAPLANQVQYRLGHAMSAKTTANTNADLLVDLQILK